jgi:hypothetical protein
MVWAAWVSQVIIAFLFNLLTTVQLILVLVGFCIVMGVGIALIRFLNALTRKIEREQKYISRYFFSNWLPGRNVGAVGASAIVPTRW